MAVEVPYELVFYVMFSQLVKYGSKKYIRIDDIDNYVNKYLELVNKAYKEDTGKEVTFSESDLSSEIDAFVDNCRLLYKKNGCIYIKDDADVSEFEQAATVISFLGGIPSVFKNTIDYSYELLKTIGATYIHDEYRKFLKNELKLEKAYYNYVMNPTKENKDALRALMIVKFSSLELLKQLPENDRNAVYMTTMDFVGEGMDLKYDELPIDLDAWGSLPHIVDYDVENFLEGLHQYAIFGKGNLGYKKLESDVDSIYESQADDPFGLLKALFDGKEEYNKGRKIFYIKYLDNIDKYLENHEDNKELLAVKARLMYSLDDPYTCLFEQKNFDKAVRDTQLMRSRTPEILKLNDAVRTMAASLFFYHDSERLTEKLLLMKTYYDVTKDEEFADIFTTFRRMPNYKEYGEFIFGKNKLLSL